MNSRLLPKVVNPLRWVFSYVEVLHYGPRGAHGTPDEKHGLLLSQEGPSLGSLFGTAEVPWIPIGVVGSEVHSKPSFEPVLRSKLSYPRWAIDLTNIDSHGTHSIPNLLEFLDTSPQRFNITPQALQEIYNDRFVV